MYYSFTWLKREMQVLQLKSVLKAKCFTQISDTALACTVSIHETSDDIRSM